MGLIAVYKETDGSIYLKIRYRFLYYVRLSASGKIESFLSEVQDIAPVLEQQIEHFNNNRSNFEAQQLFVDNDEGILYEILELHQFFENLWFQAISSYSKKKHSR